MPVITQSFMVSQGSLTNGTVYKSTDERVDTFKALLSLTGYYTIGINRYVAIIFNHFLQHSKIQRNPQGTNAGN